MANKISNLFNDIKTITAVYSLTAIVGLSSCNDRASETSLYFQGNILGHQVTSEMTNLYGGRDIESSNYTIIKHFDDATVDYIDVGNNETLDTLKITRNGKTKSYSNGEIFNAAADDYRDMRFRIQEEINKPIPDSTVIDQYLSRKR